MINAMDISGYGASNPVGAYLQNNTAWDGLRQQTGLTGGVNPNAATVGAGTGLGFNLDTGRLLLGGLQTLGNLWQAWQANKLAKDQFKFTKDVTLQNIGNQISSYNTALSDRANSRYHTQGGTPEDAAAYIEQNKLNNKMA